MSVSAWLYVRVWPTAGEATAEAVEDALSEAIPLLESLPWSGEPFGGGAPQDVGFVFSQALEPEPPDGLIRDVRQALGLAKHLAVRRPDWWVEVWDDLQLVEGTFGRMVSLLGGVVVDRDTAAPDPEGERTLAEHLGKVDLGDLDLGLPHGLDPRAAAALAAGSLPPSDADLAAIVVAATDQVEAGGHRAAARRLAALLDGVDADVLRPLVESGFDRHGPAVRRLLPRVLAALPRAEALDLGLSLLFDSPRGLALDDAAAALAPWAADPDLIASLAEVVLEEGPPQPGTRLEGVAADLLLRTPEGTRVIARRAARDREAEPFTWWAVRKLLAEARPETLPTALLYARPGARVPPWLAELLGAVDDPRARRAGAGQALSADEAEALRAAEQAYLEG